MESRNSIAWRIAATAGFVATIVVNALANALPINGLTTGDVADLYPSLFTPAGITFSIWSVIYLLLAGFIVLIWVYRRDSSVSNVLPAFVLSCILNITWILLWHHLYAFLSVLVMLGLLATMIFIFVYVQRAALETRSKVLFVRLPFTIYFSWICVATIANISAYLISTGWSGFSLSEELWAVLMLGIASILAIKIMSAFRTPTIIAVVVWTLIGVMIKWQGSDYQFLFFSALGLAVVLVAFTLIYFLRKKVY
jgi:translocator protein